MTRIHVQISGRVQGVGCRWFVREEARRLGLSGWVANLPSGEVEVRASGEDRAVDRLRRALEVGPTGAAVEQLRDVDDIAEGALPYPFAIHR